MQLLDAVSLDICSNAPFTPLQLIYFRREANYG